MPYRTNKRAQRVWKKGKPIRGKNPNLYRCDALGNVIYKPAYGRSSPMGWQCDHKWPKSRNGSNAYWNLQPLQTAANRKKSNKLPLKPASRRRGKRR